MKKIFTVFLVVWAIFCTLDLSAKYETCEEFTRCIDLCDKDDEKCSEKCFSNSSENAIKEMNDMFSCTDKYCPFDHGKILCLKCVNYLKKCIGITRKTCRDILDTIETCTNKTNKPKDCAELAMAFSSEDAKKDLETFRKCLKNSCKGKVGSEIDKCINKFCFKEAKKCEYFDE